MRTSMQEQEEQSRTGLVTEEGTIPLLGVKIKGMMRGRAVEMTVAQRYRNSEDKPIEAIYLFPAPEEAAICGLEVRIGDRVLRGEVEERGKAFDRYDEAMAEGHGALLLDQERPNVCQMSVGNILPGQEVVAEVRMIWQAPLEGEAVRLMVPSTVAPRYAPASLTDSQRREYERTAPPWAHSVPYGMTVEVEVETASEIRVIDSPSHPVRSEIDGRCATVTFSRGEVAMDRDFVLTVATGDPHRASACAARAHGRDHLVVELFPGLPAAEDRQPRNVCFLVDCSGSMDGTSIDEARRAVELCLRSLDKGDRFQVVRFGSDYEALFRQPRKFSQKSLDEAAAKVGAMYADLGGTGIMRPLQAIAKSYGNERVDLVVLTDGQVANEEEVLAFAKKHRKSMRIFSFGIGAGSSEFLVRGLAREAGGKAEFIHPGERIEDKVLRQFGRIDAPAVEDLKVDWCGLDVEQAPAETPPLFSGDALVLTARLKKGAEIAEGAEIRITANTTGGPVTWNAPVTRVENGEAIPLLWSRERIRDLEGGFGLPVGSRQERGGDRRRDSLVKLSRTYGLLSSETSFVAVEERADGERAEGPAELRKVPVAVTSGWHGTGRAGGMGAYPRLAAHDRDLESRVNASSMFMREIAWDAPAPAAYQRKLSRKRVDHETKDMSAPIDFDTPLHLRILALQNADGSFNMNKELLRLAVRRKDAVENYAKTMGNIRGARKVIATVLAIVLLHENAADSIDTWRAAEKKARKWLDGRRGVNVDELEADVRKLLTLSF